MLLHDPSNKARQRTEEKFRGNGGHMTAMLLHKIRFYDRCIKFSRMNNLDNLKSLTSARNYFVAKHREVLEQRGYWGPVDPQRDFNYHVVELALVA